MSTERLTDFSYLMSFCGNDEPFIDEMKGLFITNTPNDLQAIEEAITKKEYHTAYRLVHSLKSSINFMGISSIKEDTLKLEKCLKTETDLELVTELYTRVNETCRKAIEELS